MTWLLIDTNRLRRFVGTEATSAWALDHAMGTKPVIVVANGAAMDICQACRYLPKYPQFFRDVDELREEG